MAKTTVQLDQDRLLERLERLEQQLALVVRAQGGGFGATLLGFALGALVGGALALLYAPQRGEETRQRVLLAKEQAAQLAGQAKGQATQVAGQAQHAASRLRDQAQQAMGQGTDQVRSSTQPAPGGVPVPEVPGMQRGA